jgi:3-hydroxybutyryl-CoA dehydrogenase
MEGGHGEKGKPPSSSQTATDQRTVRVRVAVVGFGTMGRQIAQLFAQQGHQVIATDTIPDALKTGLIEIENGPYGLKAAASKGKITNEQAQTALQRIRVTPTLEEACKDADIIVEAAIEDPKLKQEIFHRLDKIASPTALLASNTSTLSITKIALATTRLRTRVIGIHFFNPAQVTKLVEVVKGQETSPDTVGRAVKLVNELGKTPVVTLDEPGFIANRLGLTLYVEASRMLEDGVANIQDIDNAMKLGYGHPMGPFETADLVGLDTRLRNLESLHAATGDARWIPPKVLREMVNQGFLGDPARKAGSKGGYYEFHQAQRQK